MSGIVTFLSLVLAASALVGCGVAALAWLWPGPRTLRPVPLDSLSEPRAFSFRDGYLVSSERGTGFLLPQPVNRLTAWDDLADALDTLVPGADEAMKALAEKNEPFRLSGRFGSDELCILGLRDGIELHVSLSTAQDGQDAIRVNAKVLSALEAENILLTQSHNASPSLAWVLNEDGQVIWANGPYQEEVQRCLGPESVTAWPIPNLFPHCESPPRGPVRRSLGGRDETDPVRWYEVMICAAKDGIRHAHAQPLGRVIAAEDSLRSFIDTLTQTFTALPIGLAIFDANRQLVMFNPPLLDMTGLDGAWLAGRPHLRDVLDSLREIQALPEPRDWQAWCNRLLGEDGPFNGAPWSESWTHASGQSFRMTARPQSAGSVAILLEDVTAERAVARRQKATNAMFAALLDASREAVAVFDAEGIVLHVNASMAALIAKNVGTPVSLDGLVRPLSLHFRPSPFWSDLRQHANSAEPVADWSQELELHSGAEVTANVMHLPDGQTALRIDLDTDADGSQVDALLHKAQALQAAQAIATG